MEIARKVMTNKKVYNVVNSQQLDICFCECFRDGRSLLMKDGEISGQVLPTETLLFVMPSCLWTLVSFLLYLSSLLI